jgi:hypothetical protein
MAQIKTVANISSGIAGVLSNNVSNMSKELGQKSKNFTLGKINNNDRKLLLRTLEEQRKVESQKNEDENQKSFSTKSHETLHHINELMVEFAVRPEFKDNTISQQIKNESIRQYTKRLEILLNTKHGDRNVFGGDGAAFDLSKAEWDDNTKRLTNMNWISIPKNGVSQEINSSVIKIVESLAEFKVNVGSIDKFNNEIKPKIQRANDQLVVGMSEAKLKINESDARIKLHNEKIVALQEEIEKIAVPDTTQFTQGLQGHMSRLTTSAKISSLHNGLQNQLIKGY